MGAESYKKEGIEQPKTDPSAADLALLQSLDAKIKALTEAESKKPRTVRPHWGDGARPLPGIDSTQTVRPLSPYELVDDEATRWFAIQLMLSADPIHGAEVPNLDIFEDYKLYSVAEPENGRPMYALRLGFFSNEVAAQSVARYVAMHFATPTVKRVSIAERERFAGQLITAGKDIGASGERTIIELVGRPGLLADEHPARAGQGRRPT